MSTLKTIRDITVGSDFNPKKPTLDMFKSSILCSARGFFIFILALIILCDSAILKDKKRQKEAVYALYHNILPFLEVIVVMIPVMLCLYKTRLSSYSMLISLGIALSICFSLRVLGVRTDCCSDLDLKKINDLDISFKTPCNSKFMSLLSDCYSIENSSEVKQRNFFHKLVFVVFVTPLLFITFIIKSLDVLLSRIIGSVFLQTGNKRDLGVEKERDYLLYLLFSCLVSCLPNCLTPAFATNFIENKGNQLQSNKDQEVCTKVQNYIQKNLCDNNTKTNHHVIKNGGNILNIEVTEPNIDVKTFLSSNYCDLIDLSGNINQLKVETGIKVKVINV